MPWLAKLKGPRGTAFDPFGRTEERRTERAQVNPPKLQNPTLSPILPPHLQGMPGW